MIGCVVDGLHSQRDVVIKSLGGYLGTIKGNRRATNSRWKSSVNPDIRAVA